MASVFEHDNLGALDSLACPNHLDEQVWIRDLDGEPKRVGFDDPKLAAEAREVVIEIARLHNLAVDKRVHEAHDALVCKHAGESSKRYKQHRIRVREGSYPFPVWPESEDDEADEDDGFLGLGCLGLFTDKEIDVQMRLMAAAAAVPTETQKNKEKKRITKKEDRNKKQRRNNKDMERKSRGMKEDVKRLEQQTQYVENQLAKAEKKLHEMEEKLSKARST